ncbi:MAG: hypothetical protein ABIQ95_15950, partial [Bdellovibrionia bacterium]
TKQRDIAFQISTLIVETGWADAKLENITMNRGGKILLVDTEPHFGEMEMNWMNDPASQGSKIWKIYDQTINKLNLSMGGSPSPPKLQNILKGLETFADDSLIHKLSVFNEVAKEFIARMRKIK